MRSGIRGLSPLRRFPALLLHLRRRSIQDSQRSWSQSFEGHRSLFSGADSPAASVDGGAPTQSRDANRHLQEETMSSVIREAKAKTGMLNNPEVEESLSIPDFPQQRWRPYFLLVASSVLLTFCAAVMFLVALFTGFQLRRLYSPTLGRGRGKAVLPLFGARAAQHGPAPPPGISTVFFARHTPPLGRCLLFPPRVI